jgi:tripartite-type tricarboxylate transporter receptor subunit TctC
MAVYLRCNPGAGVIRRRGLLGAAAFALPARARGQAPAADYPNRPLRILVGFTPGGAVDILVRAVAPRLGEALGQTVVVENRPGAGATISTEAVARSAPDGYTLGFASVGTLVVGPLVFRDLPYDPKTDLVTVALLADIANVLVVPPQRPWRSLGDLLAAARSNPGGLSWGHSGVGTAGHLAANLLDQMAGLTTVGVAYRGGAPLATDLMGGRLDYALSTTASVLAQIRDGKLRALAVSSPQRQPWLPEVPTIAEAGVPGFAVAGWGGLVAPRGTPPAVVRRLEAAVTEALADPAVRDSFFRNALLPMAGGAEDFAALRDTETRRYTPLIRVSGARAE